MRRFDVGFVHGETPFADAQDVAVSGSSSAKTGLFDPINAAKRNLGGHRNSDRVRCYSEVIAVSHQRIRARFQQIDREEKGPTRNPPAPLIRHPRSSRCGADARQATRPSAGHADPGTFG